jgi:GAF domain-containing protein
VDGAAQPSYQAGSTSGVPAAAGPARLERLRRGLTALTEEGIEDTVRLGPETVLRAVVQRLASVTGAPIAEVYAVEGETYRALTSYDGDHFDSDWEDVVLPLARYPVSRRAVENDEVVLIADIAGPLLGVEDRLSLEKWGYRSQISLPLHSAGQVIGLVELCDYVPHDFAADLDLIRVLARVAGHALETGLLAEQVAGRTRVIDELVQIGELATRAPGLDMLLRQTAERLQHALDAASCDVFRVTDDGVRCVASFDRSGFDERPVGALLDLERHPTVLQAMNAHEVLIVPDPDDPKLSEAERSAYRELGYVSEVCVPVVLHDRLHGLIDVYDTRRRDYAEYVGLLRGAAHLLAAAFENARLEESLQRRSAAVDAIAELGALGGPAAGVGPPLAGLAQSIRTALDAADCDIYSVENEQLRCLVSVDADGTDTDVTGTPMDVDRFPATALALRSGEIVTIPDLDDPRLTDEERRDMGEWGYRSELCIPLVSGSQVTGLIDVFDTRPRDYVSHRDYLEGVGRVAAAVIERAALAEYLQRLSSMSAGLAGLRRDILAATGRPAVLRAVCSRVPAAVDAAACDLYWVADGRLVMATGHGRPAGHRTACRNVAAPPAARRALDDGTAVVVEAPDEELGSGGEAEAAVPSEIWVPVMVRGRSAGLLRVMDRRRRDFAEVRAFLTEVAGVVAEALERIGDDVAAAADGHAPSPSSPS